ncbi:MAG: transglutaminase domain-containing protein [Anaerolineae bacterium]|nr:transglutaminase domain-containing protein [Anaerolineae bacterium]
MKTRHSTQTRWWDITTALLLIAALTTAAGRLVATRWIGHLSIVHTMVFLAALLGLALGWSRFSGFLAAVLGAAYGLIIIPWQLGLVLGYAAPWNARLAHLVGRMGGAFGQLLRQETVSDSLLFLALLACLAWGLGVHSGYALTRHGSPWRAVLPPGVAMLIIHESDPAGQDGIWILAIYLVLALLLLACMAYVKNRARWRKEGAALPPYLGLEVGRVILLIVALPVLLVWATPALVSSAVPVAEQAWQVIIRPLEPVGEFFSNAFASFGGEERVGGVYYSASLVLGDEAALGDAPMLNVWTSSASPPAGMHYYWRAHVYDRYADGHWVSTLSDVQPILPAGLAHVLEPQQPQGRLAASFIFTPTVDLTTLYVAPQPLWVSRPVQADLASNPDGSVDLSALHAAPYVNAGEAYAARSSLGTAAVAQLREAGTDYPAWVTERYLQLPSSITPRTQALAREIAAGLDNPYDIAAAVTDYLRDNIEYVETVDSPPEGQEPLDYFLFDSRQGFCNYYASAEIVLLRSLGIPSRLAAGLAQGTQQGQSGVYVVLERDAHAWPEVYFPGFGWIEFEPTASQPPLSRPEDEELPQPGEGEESAASDETDEASREERDRFEDRFEELLAMGEEPSAAPSTVQKLKRTASWALPLALGLGLAALAWRFGRRRGLPPLPVLLERGLQRYDVKPPSFLHWWAIWATQTPVARAYLALNQALARLGASPAPSETPSERAANLARLLPAASVPAQSLLAEYHAEVYGPHAGDVQVARQAGRAISVLSWRTVISARVERLLRPLAFVIRRLTVSHHSRW